MYIYTLNWKNKINPDAFYKRMISSLTEQILRDYAESLDPNEDANYSLGISSAYIWSITRDKLI